MKEVIGNFKILAKVGEGGMGNVFRGRDLMLERDVAIKSLRPELACYPEVVERFRTEAIALARLQHQNIANVFSFFAEDGQYYMVMEFVDGEPLNRLARRRGALPWREAVALVVQALYGLEHAHHAGVVHRDIKPSNMIVTADGTLKLMDFGIARILEKVGLTRTGCVVGTLLYVSPEQARGGDIDARSDLYSMAVVLYELLTGRAPFDSPSEFELMRAHIELPPPPPSGLVNGLPPGLEAVILRALAKDPADRFQRAEAFRSELEHLLAAGADSDRTVLLDLPNLPPAAKAAVAATLGGTRAVGPAATAPVTPPATPPKRSLAPLLAGAALVLVGIVGAIAWLALRPAGEPAAPPQTAAPVPPVTPPAPTAPAAAETAPVPLVVPAVQPEMPAAPAPVVESAPPPVAEAAPAPAPVPAAVSRPAPERTVRSEPARPARAERTPPPPAPQPVAKAAAPRHDGRCARLIQQLSLGERLAEADLSYLRANCGD